MKESGQATIPAAVVVAIAAASACASAARRTRLPMRDDARRYDRPWFPDWCTSRPRRTDTWSIRSPS